MRDLILHLGGDWRRVQRTAIEARRRLSAPVLISGALPEFDRVADFLMADGMPRERLIFDATAYDTVGNFTTTWPMVRRLGARRVYVVTSHWHMERAMAIAHAAYWGRGVTAVACPWHDGTARRDRGNTQWDVMRTVQWRITGRPTSRDYKGHG